VREKANALDNKELLLAIERLARKKGWNSTETCRQLGVHQNTLTNWRNGGRISIRNKSRIASLLEQNDIFLSKDHLTIAAFEKWEKLSESNRTLVLKYIIELIEAQGSR
jgi:transposase-like protein